MPITSGNGVTADEAAEMGTYLPSDKSQFVTSAEFVIDGGMSAR